MVYYKSCRYIDGKVRWVIIDEDYNIVNNPTNEQLKVSIIGDPPKKCCVCRSMDTYINPNDVYGIERWYRHKLYGEERIVVYKDFSKCGTVSKYEHIEKFKVDENIKDVYDDYYQDIMYYLKDKEYFGIEYIKDWLKGGERY